MASYVEVDLKRLEKNFHAVRQRVGPSVKICGVVKADAYGLGAVPIAQRLSACGIDFLAVYSPAQAVCLADNVSDCPVMILMPVRTVSEMVGLEKMIVDERLHLTIHDEIQLEEVNALGCHFETRIPVHLHLDTGMSRGGLDDTSLDRVLKRVPNCEAVRVTGLCTHLAAGDDDPDFSRQQLNRLRISVDQNLLRLPDDLLIHAANTFGVLRDRQFHQSLVRVGLGLYGYGPRLMQSVVSSTQSVDLQPIVRWASHLVHVKEYCRGTPVGYNCTYCLPRDSRLGLVPVGYADGYPLALGGKSVVELMVDGSTRELAPVLGKVNMDQIIVDLTDIQAPVDIGIPVELISSDPNSPCALEQLARCAGSSCYEMLCRLSPRLPRRYREAT